MDQKIIDKIGKILARADASRNDNPHEREIAMRQANALLIKHGLSMADVTDQAERKDTLGAMGRKETELTSKYVWEAGVWAEVAKMNNCQVVRTSSRGRKSTVWVIGRYMACQITKQMAEYVVRSIRREAKAGRHSICSFGVGAWTGIGEQVTNILEARKAGVVDGEQLPEETALVVVNQDAMAVKETRKAMSEFFPRCRSGSYSHGGDSSSIAAGREYGGSVSLNGQLGQSRRAIGHS